MNGSMNALGTVVAPGQDLILRAFGWEVRDLLTGEQTGGRQSLWIETTPPGGPDIQRIVAISAEHGNHLVEP
jgi:hypothetical protein